MEKALELENTEMSEEERERWRIKGKILSDRLAQLHAVLAETGTISDADLVRVRGCSCCTVAFCCRSFSRSRHELHFGHFSLCLPDPLSHAPALSHSLTLTQISEGGTFFVVNCLTMVYGVLAAERPSFGSLLRCAFIGGDTDTNAAMVRVPRLLALSPPSLSLSRFVRVSVTLTFLFSCCVLLHSAGRRCSGRYVYHSATLLVPFSLILSLPLFSASSFVWPQLPPCQVRC